MEKQMRYTDALRKLFEVMEGRPDIAEVKFHREDDTFEVIGDSGVHICIGDELRNDATPHKRGTKKGFLDIKIGDVVVAFDEYGHDYAEHRIEVTSIEHYDEYINGKANPCGRRCYGIDLDCCGEESDCFDADDYIEVVTEGNFVRFDE